jgi:hypothetical protein
MPAEEIANWQRLTGRRFGCTTVTARITPKGGGQAFRTTRPELSVKMTATAEPK